MGVAQLPPPCRLKARIPPSLCETMASPHTQPVHLLPSSVHTAPTVTGTHPLKLSLCPWHWPDPEEERGMLDAGGKGGEGWVAQFLG